MSDIYLFQCTSDPKKLEKELGSKLEITNTFRLKEPCNVLEPTVTLSKETVGDKWALYNYAYIPLFRRYYFCKRPGTLHDGLLTYDFKVDPLMSWSAQLLQTPFEIARSEVCYTRMFVDKERALLAQKVVTNRPIGAFPQDSSGNNFVLTVAGGATNGN